MNIALLFTALFMFRSVVEYLWWVRILFLVACGDAEFCGRRVSRFFAIGGRGNELIHFVIKLNGSSQKLWPSTLYIYMKRYEDSEGDRTTSYEGG